MMGSRTTGVEPLSNVDAAWLRMEDSTNLMTITAVMSFSECLDYKELKSIIEDRLLCYDRFRQRVIESRLPFARPRWQEDDHFNLRSHLQRVALPAPGEQAELQELVSHLMSTPLDSSKPLWQFQYVENYRGGSALVTRIHHCIADGIALVRVLLNLTDDSPAKGPTDPEHPRRRQSPLGGGFWLPEVVNEALRSARKVTAALVEEGLETILQPGRAAELAKEGTKITGVLARLVTMSPDPKTAFRGQLGAVKRCAWSEIMPLDTVKAYGKQVGATINDVLIAGVAGALRRHLINHGAEIEGVDIRAVIPVNLRPDHTVGQLGNRFGLVFLPLPIGTADPDERLQALKAGMDEIKGSSEAIVVFGLLNTVGMASAEIEGMALQLFGSKATAVMTNVPGPREEIYLAGKAVRSMMFWVPQAAHLGLGVSILSYAGQVRLGVATDAGLIPQPQEIIDAFQDEMNTLVGYRDCVRSK
jgi:diacylglycerol O-acyltransferase